MASAPLDPAKFRDPARTALGEPRARVALRALATLWLNTGTLCNIECARCYIESGPRNDRLAYLRLADVLPFLDEIRERALPTRTLGLTGGEPFMNPDVLALIDTGLGRGFRVLVLTNAMRPMMRHAAGLLALRARHREGLVLRVSLDHYTKARHEEERGPRSFESTLDGLHWLAEAGFAVCVAGRTLWGEDVASLRAGYARLFAERRLAIDAADPAALVLFPEMDARADVPEITESCFEKLHVHPDTLMCASSRMLVKRRGAPHPVVLPCTLLPYDARFELGATLAAAAGDVPLNHPHCARFCVLGGGSCDAGGPSPPRQADRLE
jgi:uncharacterized Fe-S cluster-containing radical SAM superfamily protein